MSNPLFVKNKHHIDNRFTLLLVLAALAVVVLAACSGQGSATTAPSAASSRTGPVSFSRDVLPLLQGRCAGCHSDGRAQSGLSVSSYDSLMAGSGNGAVIVPGDVANSRLVQLVQAGRMPKSGPKLTSDQIQILVDWVKAGALNN